MKLKQWVNWRNVGTQTHVDEPQRDEPNDLLLKRAD